MRRSTTAGFTSLLVASLVACFIWLSDRVTLQGERTIYTVKCEHGEWAGERCTGVLVPGERYAFRASASRNEVFHWIRGTSAPSGMFGECTVKDRDNWTCKIPTGPSTTATCAMVKGIPTPGCRDVAVPFHDVPKWKWWAMRAGITLFTDARD